MENSLAPGLHIVATPIGNLGDISVGLLNATDTDYKLNPLNPYVELPRERVVAARVRLRF